MILCEVCGIKITKKNFWEHKHRMYMFGDETNVKNNKTR